MTGTLLALANSSTEPLSGCLITMMSLYPLRTCAVSARDSPLVREEEDISVVSLTAPPRRLNAEPKLILVLVLGSKNILLRIAPSKTLVSSFLVA